MDKIGYLLRQLGFKMSKTKHPQECDIAVSEARQQIYDEIMRVLPMKKAISDENDICIACKKHIDICNCELNFTWNDCLSDAEWAIKKLLLN